jgi:putative transposase
MPRQARLDAPGTLHHVIIRGLERGAIVKDDVDREAFVTRLGAVAQATGTAIYGWALLPNHAHLLLRSGPAGLPRFMRRLLTGYAITFNRRHKRLGHLFHNRYKSIVCEEDAYFQELVRYIHLNPLRAQMVANLRGLDRYPWCGHATVVGRIPRPWQDRRTVLGWFGRTEGAGALADLRGGGPKCARSGAKRNPWPVTRVSWGAEASSQGSCARPRRAKRPRCGGRRHPEKRRR